MKALSTFSIVIALLSLTACSSDKGYDVEGKWGYRERMQAQNSTRPKPTVSLKTQDQAQSQPTPSPMAKDTVPCETTLSADGCGASPRGQKAAEIPVNQ